MASVPPISESSHTFFSPPPSHTLSSPPSSHTFSSPPPPHHDSELHAYIALLEDEIRKKGGTLPTHRPLVLGLLPTRTQPKSAYKSFFAGAGAAVVGGMVTHPIDVIKVRQQLFGMKDGFGVGSSWVAQMRTKSFVGVSAQLIRDEGVRGLFKGVSAGMLRQAAFVGTKFVLYEQLKEVAQSDRGDLSFRARCVCACAAGVGGAIIGNPFDLAMVRMQADGKLPTDKRRNYKNGIDAVVRIVREEGIRALWRGCEATVARGAIITASQFAIYDQTKYELTRYGLMSDGWVNILAASLAASFVSGVSSNPFDVAKSRLFQMTRRKKDNKWPYNGMVDCLIKTANSEGVVALWRGLGACIGRQIPLNAVRFLVMEQLTCLLGN